MERPARSAAASWRSTTRSQVQEFSATTIGPAYLARIERPEDRVCIDFHRSLEVRRHLGRDCFGQESS